MAAVYEMATPDTGIEIYNVFNEGRVKVEPTIEEVLERVKRTIVTETCSVCSITIIRT